MTSGRLLPTALASGIEQLEPMPVTAQRLVALMQGDDVSLARIAELVEFDQAIAASVLRLARLWMHAGSRPPETVHDIGTLVMRRGLNATVEFIVHHAKQQGVTFVEAEQQLFGVNHAAVGAAIAVEWHFPEVVTDAIARHHDVDVGASTPVLDAVVIANMVAKNIGMGLGAEGFNLTVDSQCVHRLGLDFTRFARVYLQTDTWLRELRAQVGIPSKSEAGRQ